MAGEGWPGGLVEEEANISWRSFDEPGEDPFGSINGFPASVSTC
jgi:hypothetical protein